MSTPSRFGRELRYWRGQRGLSQLDLATASGTTSRHLSFLETGRSRPSATMVERLCETLGVPLRQRNRLFEAAGLVAPYRVSGLDDQGLAPYRAAMRQLLDAHLPYPGMVVDRAWDIVEVNATGRLLLGPEETNVARMVFEGSWRSMLENWPAVAWSGLERLRDDEARHPDDPRLAELVAMATTALEGVPRPTAVGSELVQCPCLRIGDQLVPTLAVVAQFRAPRDVTVEELRVELIYPEDEVGRRFFAELAGAVGAPDPTGAAPDDQPVAGVSVDQAP